MNDLYNKRDDTYKEYSKMLEKTINDTADEFLLGNPVDDILNLFNLYHLQLQIGWEGVVGMTEEDITCMSDTLFCNGVYANHMNNIYSKGGGGGSSPGDGTPSPSDDGIGFMQIEGKGVHPINRIR